MAESNQIENSRVEIVWTEADAAQSAHWRSENGMNVPKRVVVADDTMRADDAYRLACEGTGILWRGDFQNARQLVQAMARRSDRKQPPLGATPAETFHLQRRAKGLRARTLSMVLIEVGADFGIGLRRAPNLALACEQAYGKVDAPFVTSLRELLGVASAQQWRLKGVEVTALGRSSSGMARRVFPHYGVFSPVRGEYVDLVAQAPLPGRPGSESSLTALDLGTGTGVLAAVLAQRGVGSVVGTESNVRAIDCARENIDRLGLASQVAVVEGDVFPPTDTRADIVVCNPPWIPARPTALIEQGVYDPESRMLRRFLAGLPDRLADGGEGWLILSDLAERLGLRAESDLPDMIDAAGLSVLEKLDTAPRHPRADDSSDPLHAQRSAEVTSLYRLVVAL
ncbi:methyltransferase [Tomitella biformata]|uniref:methyltransferase n=1 Tax=Tomitella biformata TaxID=630403 RepID=UPI000465DC24|nr:class I SAM-dependent methyltransferase [Tomitella biformata]